ncbi:MAG: hypothetical protein QXG12_04355 [Thermoproteota archaeon]
MIFLDPSGVGYLLLPWRHLSSYIFANMSMDSSILLPSPRYHSLSLPLLTASSAPLPPNPAEKL